MIPLGKGLATEAAKVPSGYLRRMSGKMIIPSHCIRLMDCVGQGEIVCSHSSSDNIRKNGECIHTKIPLFN